MTLRNSSRGFTLIELLASIALVLLLVVGINSVFGLASKGIQGGQALSTVQRDNTGAQAVFFQDLKGAVMPPNASGANFDDGPCFIIRSERQYAYRNQPDHLGDAGADPESPTANQIRDQDIDGDNNQSAAENTYPAIYNNRSHRTDWLAFFARGSFPRQTGNAGTYVAPMSSSEAYIWYGHLQLPDLKTTNATLARYVHKDPGLNPRRLNQDNFYASQWVLGRMVMTLREPNGAGVISDDRGVSQAYISRPAYPAVPTDAALNTYYNNLAPFSQGSSSGDGFQVQWSRYDLAGTSIAEYADIVRGRYQRFNGAPSVDPYYVVLTTSRFQGNPYPDRPLSSFGMARSAPMFLRGASQFMVEFAGDFVTQDNNPSSTAFGHVSPQNPPVPDGVTDFVAQWTDANNNGLIEVAEAAAGVRRATRWYGMPRDTNGDGVILGWTAGRNANLLQDVVPLRDVVSSGIGVVYDLTLPNSPQGYEIEKFVNLGTPTNGAGNYVSAAGGMVSGANYYASWGPDTTAAPKPRLIRITIALDEPSGTMADPQWFEYVIDLP